MSESAVLFIHALTGLHPGSGTALGLVDLPVQRERHTQWPVCPGSSLKGIFRDSYQTRLGKTDDFFAVFGPETDKARDHAGAVSLTDARLLAFPVRSLRGVFAWVTCPAALQRLQRDLLLAGPNPADPPPAAIPDIGKDKAGTVEAPPLAIEAGRLLLEEFEFTIQASAAAETKAWADWIAAHAIPGTDAATATRVRSHLAILHDNDFTHFVRFATEVTARVGLDYDTKTVKDGALFYEEFLPPETIFYSLVIAEKSRKQHNALTADGVLEFLATGLPRHVQIGADATIGKGLCALRLNRLTTGKPKGGQA